MGTFFLESFVPKSGEGNRKQLLFSTIKENVNTLVRWFCYIVSFLYISFFIPIFPFIAPFGALVTAREGVGTVATFSCIIATSLIPLSMPVSCYFMLRHADRPGRMFSFAFLPFGMLVLAFMWMSLISWLHS